MIYYKEPFGILRKKMYEAAFFKQNFTTNITIFCYLFLNQEKNFPFHLPSRQHNLMRVKLTKQKTRTVWSLKVKDRKISFKKYFK